MYSQCSENECFILIRHYYSSVRFIFVSISHILNFMNCYGVYFDIIGYIELQCLIQFYFIWLEIKIKIKYYVCSILHILEFEFTFFSFSSLKANVFLTKDNGFFHRYHRQWLTFSLNVLITLSPMSVTCRSYRWHCWQFKPKIFYFRHLAGSRVTVVH